MPNSKLPFNLPIILLTAVSVAIFVGVGLHRLQIDTDIIGSLPADDPVLSDARQVLSHHPMQDQLVIDIAQRRDNPEILVRAAEFVSDRLRQSGLFERVGMKQIYDLAPDLIDFVTSNFPVLFTEKDLHDHIAPLLAPQQIRRKLNENFRRLLNIESIGQAELVSRDPLGIRDFALAKLAGLSPSHDARMYKGHLLSSDGRHLLLTARPRGSGTDTRYARRATDLIHNVSAELNEKYAQQGVVFSLTPVGAFRAALDNENMAKGDIRRVILFSAVGIALLLILAFPRPYIGLLSLLPAVAGTAAAFFIYSLWHNAISILTIGFGGAIVSITVDHGIAYLLFLDRPYESSGREAAKEVWAVGLLATLTSVGAFLVLTVSGFSILSQIGQFAALGIACSFIFVHVIFPRVFPTMPPAMKKRPLPLAPIVRKLAFSGGAYRAYAALAFALVMLMFARPEFNTDFREMNTISVETRAAEKLVADVWGDISTRIFLMSEADSVRQLQHKSDQLAQMLEEELAAGTLASGFVPSMLFPGDERGKENFSAWRKFWNKNRIAALRQAIAEASVKWGFTSDAFEPFFEATQKKVYRGIDIPQSFFPLLGIFKQDDGAETTWVQFATLTPAPGYRAGAFYSKFSDSGTARAFDPAFFSEKLGERLAATFLRMVLMVGVSVIVLLFVFFFDWQLTLVALLPVAFAFISTLGTLRLSGHPLDIPGLMLSIIILGMGVDYSLFFVRAHQRYRDASHPSTGLIRMAVFLAAASTLVGFGALNFAEHRLLKSAGLTCFLGIGYSLIGAFIILPPLLERVFKPTKSPAVINDAGGTINRNPVACALSRFRHMEAVPRLIAFFRIRFDPMFRDPIPFPEKPYTILDIGTGYGIPAAWLLEMFPDARIYGIDPAPERVRLASIVIGERGAVRCTGAPDMPAVPESNAPAELAVMIDMVHLLSAEDARLTFKRLHSTLCRNGILILRTRISSENGRSGISLIEKIGQRFTASRGNLRSADDLQRLMAQAGFRITDVKPCGSEGWGHWFFLRK